MKCGVENKQNRLKNKSFSESIRKAQYAINTKEKHERGKEGTQIYSPLLFSSIRML